MNNLFERSSSHWVRYDKYELKEAEDGKLYVTPAENAKPEAYDPLKNADTMVQDALNVGLLMMKRAEDAEVAAAVMKFVTNYGLLGFMTALPTTPTFMDYEAVYLPKNKFIKQKTLSTEDYLINFYPFDKPEIKKRGVESQWDVSGDRKMIALAMTFADKAMAAFDGIAPSYHIALMERPTIVWDFQSLLLGIQMMFNFALTDERKPLRSCKHCQKVFMASRPNAVFCSPRCKNQYNVYKSRAKDKHENN